MKKLLLITLVMSLLPAIIFAGGETGADVLKVESGGRAIGLGGAYAASGGDVGSILYNPAGISYITGREVQYAHWESFSGIRIEHISYAQYVDIPMLEGNLGISLLYRHMDAIDNEDAPDAPLNFYDFILTGTFANNLGRMISDKNLENISLGLNVKIIFENIGIYQGNSFAFDLGGHFIFPGTGLKLGLVIQNAGPPIKIISEEAPLPLTVRGGAAYQVQVNEDNVFEITSDIIYDIYDYPKFALGIEDTILKIFSMRAGYNIPADFRSPSYFSAGIGLSITQFDITAVLNYTYRPVLWNFLNEFGSTHIASFDLKF